MKVILSRKGVDSSSGGFASPILKDNRLVPVAIPDDRSPIRYRDLQYEDLPIGPLVKHLSHDRLNGWSRVHLDPDLAQHSLKKRKRFTPVFGQCGAAQSHLTSYQVDAGDLFLFFGWFKRAEYYRRRWRYVPQALDQHVIFGWLQIESVLTVEQVLEDDRYVHLREHPHCYGKFSGSNTLYVGRSELSFDSSLHGAGYFDAISADRTLTAEGCNRSLWELPGWMFPQSPDYALSYHQDQSRWQLSGDTVSLQSVARGQEFVLDTAHYPEALGWVESLFASSA